MYAFSCRADKFTARQVRYLSYIPHFTTQIDHVPGRATSVAYALLRDEKLSLAGEISSKDVADEQGHYLTNGTSSLTLKLVSIKDVDVGAICLLGVLGQ